MNHTDRKKHWEKIYQTKTINEVSWYEPTPTTSLAFLNTFKIPLDAKIIDIGGGDSFFVDHLLALGYQNITVLDISAAALERAKLRIGRQADLVKWIVADAASFAPTEQYDFWHDRAAFHFLTSEQEIDQYLHIVQNNVTTNGTLIIGTFSESGPNKCSGIDTKQYSETSMANRLKKYFEKIKCITVDHVTPFNTLQNFIFCSFKKLSAV